MLRVRIDRHRCIGAGNCITLAPTAFDWLPGDHFKAEVADIHSVEEDVLREAAASCPTQAIEIESVEELLPWQLLSGAPGPQARRVLKTFMFTDIVKSTNLVEALGDDAWMDLIRWHDETLRKQFRAHAGEELSATGDGFFVGFDTPEAAVACAVAIQQKFAEHRRKHGFAPQVRIGIHASEAAEMEGSFRGKGVHEAARIAALAGGGEIIASASTITPGTASVSEPRSETLRGIAEPVEVVTVFWS